MIPEHMVIPYKNGDILTTLERLSVEYQKSRDARMKQWYLNSTLAQQKRAQARKDAGLDKLPSGRAYEAIKKILEENIGKQFYIGELSLMTKFSNCQINQTTRKMEECYMVKKKKSGYTYVVWMEQDNGTRSEN